jgi:PDGLE domain
VTISARSNWFVIGGLGIALLLVLLVAPFASDEPDGLEKVARDKDISSTGPAHPLGDSPVADYAVERVGHQGMSTGLAGAIGVVVCFGVAYVSIRLVRSRRREPHGKTASGARS